MSFKKGSTTSGNDPIQGVCYENTGMCVPEGAVPEGYLGQPLMVLKVDGSVVKPLQFFVYDFQTKDCVEITMAVGSVGQPLLTNDVQYAKDTGVIMYCDGAAFEAADAAAVGAEIAADGAEFPDGTAYDPANPDHEIISVSVQSFFCGSDPCKNGNLVVDINTCITKAGEPTNLEQAGVLNLEGSETDGPIDADAGYLVPATGAARVCYTIQDKSQVVK